MRYDGYYSATTHATTSSYYERNYFLRKILIFAHKQTTGILKHVIFSCM